MNNSSKEEYEVNYSSAVLAGFLFVAGMLLGGLIGGVLGSFFHKGLGLSKEDLERLNGELDGGKAVVAILAEAYEADAVTSRLSELGGVPEQHEVSDEAVEQAGDAVEAAAETDPELAVPAA
jgi:hypothetical protein